MYSRAGSLLVELLVEMGLKEEVENMTAVTITSVAGDGLIVAIATVFDLDPSTGSVRHTEDGEGIQTTTIEVKALLEDE